MPASPPSPPVAITSRPRQPPQPKGRSLQPLGLYAANSIFVGDYLTTPGQAALADYDMIRDAGFVLEAPDGSALGEDSASKKQVTPV